MEKQISHPTFGRVQYHIFIVNIATSFPLLSLLLKMSSLWKRIFAGSQIVFEHEHSMGYEPSRGCRSVLCEFLFRTVRRSKIKWSNSASSECICQLEIAVINIKKSQLDNFSRELSRQKCLLLFPRPDNSPRDWSHNWVEPQSSAGFCDDKCSPSKC